MKKITVNLLFDVLKELNECNDRSLAIVGTALIESSLEYLIKEYLVNDENKTDKFISKIDFHSKIQLAYFLGLISKDEYNDINCIREIRNLFEHELGVFDLNNKNIKNISRRFIIPKKMGFKNDNLREMLLITYELLFFNLYWRGNKIKHLDILEDDGYEKIKRFLIKSGDFLNSVGVFFKNYSKKIID